MEKIELINRMIGSNPKDSNAWYLLGIEHTQNNNFSEALQAYSEALKYCDESLKADIITALSSLSTIVQEKTKYKEETEEEGTIINNVEAEDNLIPLRVVSGGRNNKVILEEEKNKSITFKDVGGLEELKDTIRMKIIRPFSTPRLFEKFRKKSGGGILLFGPPGCGKTFIAKATAGECRAEFIPVRITDILDPYLGVSSQNIKNVFTQARAKRPCILFIDEIDTIGFNRSRHASEHMRPVVDQLLTEIEGIESNNERMLIMGATNTPWDVDPALKRPGRFDRLIFVMPPDAAARREIFMLKMKGRPSENIDYTELARRTELYSGADIENVVEIAIENVISSIMKTGIERKISMRDLLNAVETTKPSTVEWLKTIETYIKYSNNSLFSDVEVYLKSVKRYLEGR
jgi:SpoVK/Ycf46/Vps4 family AAA+-type ATPase